MLLLLLVDVDAVIVVVDSYLLSEKPSAVYPEAVSYGAQKLNAPASASQRAMHALMRESF